MKIIIVIIALLLTGLLVIPAAAGLELGLSDILGHAAPPEIDSLAVYEGINVTP